MNDRPRQFNCVVLLLAGLSLTACNNAVSRENDRLRALTADLTERNQSLTDRVAGLEKSLAAAERKLAGDGPPPLPEGLARPQCVKLELGRFSGGIDTDNDGVDDALRLYLVPLDSRNRFTQTLGTVKLTVVHIPPGQPAVTLATHTWPPLDFDAAYRSSLAGTHYTLQCPVSAPPPPGSATVTVRLQLLDALTGDKIDLEAQVRWTGR